MCHNPPREGDRMVDIERDGGREDAAGRILDKYNREIHTNRGTLRNDHGVARPADDVRR